MLGAIAIWLAAAHRPALAPLRRSGRWEKIVTPAAQRMRAYRRRQRDGMIRLSIDVPDVAITELLVRNRYMARLAADADDRAVLRDALQRFLDDLCVAPVTVSRIARSISGKLSA